MEEERIRKLELKLLWSLTEYFEIALLHVNNEHAKRVSGAVWRQIVEFVSADPIILGRQLPVLTNQLRLVLQMTNRQIREQELYSTVLSALYLVFDAVPHIFYEPAAFEAFAETFLNKLGSHSLTTKQWQQVVERLVELLRTFWSWHPTLAAELVKRNIHSLAHLNSLYGKRTQKIAEFLNLFPERDELQS